LKQANRLPRFRADCAIDRAALVPDLHDSLAKAAGMEGSGFFEKAKAHKDQQSRS
jgi:hypothetical protein